MTFYETIIFECPVGVHPELPVIGVVGNDAVIDDLRGARPDISMLVQEISKGTGNSSRRLGNIHKIVDYPPDVVYIPSILNILHSDDKKEFDKVKRIILDFYPGAVEKVKKRTKK